MFSEMKKLKSLVIVMVCLTLATNIYANTPPVVSNVTAAQREDNSNLVDIYYDLADTDGDSCTVWVVVSDNNGVSWRVPADSFSGAVGQGIDPGSNKHVVWDAGQDMPGKSGNFKARVWADDGKGPSMVLVPGGMFPYQNGDPVYVHGFMIDKYEVTIQRYCQFLNGADPDGVYWHSGQGIYRMGDVGNYYYEVQPGQENYPVCYVTYYDAEAFAAWRSSQTGHNYRLPTGPEWEKAAGWDPVLEKLWTYGFQQDFPEDIIGCEWCNWGGSYCYGYPLEVGSFDGTDGKEDAHSYYGCYDMSGNYSEWTADRVENGMVVRGGHYASMWRACQVTYRVEAPNEHYPRLGIGFRLVMELN